MDIQTANNQVLDNFIALKALSKKKPVMHTVFGITNCVEQDLQLSDEAIASLAAAAFIASHLPAVISDGSNEI